MKQTAAALTVCIAVLCASAAEKVLLADSSYSLAVPSDPKSARTYDGSSVKSYIYNPDGTLKFREWRTESQYYFERVSYDPCGRVTGYKGFGCQLTNFDSSKDPYSELFWHKGQGRITTYDDLGRIKSDTTLYSGGFGDYAPVMCHDYSYSGGEGEVVYSNKWWNADKPQTTTKLVLKEGWPVSGIEYTYGTTTVVGSYKYEYSTVNGKPALTKKETFFADGKPRFLDQYSYDEAGNLTEEYSYIYEFTTPKGVTPESATLTVHSYGVPQEVAVTESVKTKAAAVSPIALRGKSLTSLTKQPVKAEVFSLSGKRAASGTLPLELPSSGVFIVRTVSPDGISIDRISVE